MENNSLTVIVPVYNEEESLKQFAKEMATFLDESPVPAKVLFVNDGSTDRSSEIIEEICREDSRYRYLHLDRNYGLSVAIKAGIDACDTELLGYIDSDIQTSPMDFLKFLEFFPQYDMVNGVRQKRKDSPVKKVSSKIANAFRRFAIDDGMEDTCCPLKIMKTGMAKRMHFFTGMHRFMPALVQLEGGTVKQVPVRHFPRYAGTAKYHLWNRLIGPLVDTFAFMWMKRRHIRYGIKDTSKT